MSRQRRTDVMSAQDSTLNRSPRPRELQDWLNFHLYHPLSWRIANRLVPTSVTPNMVSIAGMLCVFAAAAAYATPGWPVPALVGMLLHMTWHVVDGADGDLARLTGRTSPRGEMVDGVCDYLGHIALYVVLALLLSAQIGVFAWMLAVASGASRAAQSNHFEVQRRQYQWWAYGTPWLRHAPAREFADNTAFSAFYAYYFAMAKVLSRRAQAVDAALAAAVGDPARIRGIQAIVRGKAGDLLPRLQLLGANWRTIAIGLSMLADSALYFFLFEAVFLNLVLLHSVRRYDAALARLREDIDRLPASTSR